MRQFVIGMGVLGMVLIGSTVQASVILDGVDQGLDFSLKGIYDNDSPAGSQTGQDGNGNSVSAAAYVGNYLSGSRLYFERTVIIFPLPVLPTGRTLESVTLSFHYYGKQGTPLGDADLFHLSGTDHATVVAADYEATADLVLASFVTTASATGMLPGSPLDVTSLVEADYSSPGTDHYAAFRVQKAATWADNTTAGKLLYNFTNVANPGGGAVLTITTVPEPASITLIAVGGLLLLGRRRRAAE